MPPQCEELTGDAIDLWDEARPHIDTLLTTEPDTPDFDEARAYVIESGPELRESSDRIVQRMREHAERNDRKMGSAIFGALLFNIVLLTMGFALSRRYIMRPLRKLDRAAEKLRAGHFETRVTRSQGGEIGILEETFNAMSARWNRSSTR